ncbi:MAG: helix-turn-helix transcriptional regulator [Eubacteriales bacterium]
MSNRRLSLVKKVDKCSCKGYNLDKLLQPNILSLLAGRALHGYMIIQELEKKNLFKGEKIDNAGIYRTLKHLEEKGLVDSEWDVEEAGSAKRVYRINISGRECLGNWIRSLEDYKLTIESIIQDANRALSNV